MPVSSSTPRKAVVLAAGLGLRLRPFTLFQPKPLMPLGGRPLIEHSLMQLEAWGVTEIAVNVHWLAPQLQDYLASRRGAAKIHISREPQILGTAGALLPLRDFIGDTPFWMVNADIVWRMSPAALLRAWRTTQPLAAVWLLPDKGPRTVETDAAGTITTYRSRQRGAPGTSTFSGVQIIAPRIYDYLSKDSGRAVTLVEVYEAAARAGERVIGVASKKRSDWEDAGSVADYLRLRHRFRGGGADAPRSPIDANFSVSRNDRVWFPAALWPDPALAPTLVAKQWPLGQAQVEPLAARGSDRSFLRVRCNRESAIYIRCGSQREENLRYAGHARLLREAGVAVPDVLLELRASHVLLLEDVGDLSLRDALRAHPEQAEVLYRKTLPEIVRLHTAATRLAGLRQLAMEPAFDRRLYAWERDLFLNQIVRNRHGVTAALPDPLMQDYDRVADALLGVQAAVIVHRDLQSTNVMLRHGRPALIDFQGMRPGAASYDLASLLCDPYVSLPAALRERLLGLYAEQVGGEAGSEAVRLFAFGAVQRLTQALGAYGRLTALGLSGWQQHIVPAAVLLAEMAAQCGLANIHELACATVDRERKILTGS
jgi:aminoglycoside/choline kinase family phosphotransferase/dTDP-glucose pyrophosphorylase